MYKYNLPSIAVFIFGVLLFNGQVSQQFALDVVPQPGSDVIQADAHSAVGEKAVTPKTCGGSIPQSVCIIINSKCTCYVRKQLPWRQALDFCKSISMNLMSIATAQVQADINTNLMPFIVDDTTALKTGGIWTAGVYIPALDNYYWTTAQQLFTYTNWFYGEPDRYGANQCVYITPTSQATWVTGPCLGAYLPFICQA